MKILITTDAYYPMTNGVVISTETLYNQLKSDGHDVRILTLSSEGKGYISGDIYYLSAGAVSVYPDAKIIKPIRSRVISDIMDWEPEIIHSQTEFSTMVVAKYIKRKLDIPQIHTYHTMYEDYLKYFLKGKVIKKNSMVKLTRLLLNSFDVVIAPTEKVKTLLSSYQVTKEIIQVIPTGIDLSKFNSEITEVEKENILREYGFSCEDNIIIYVGRIAEEKNIDELIYLFSNAVKVITDIKFLIVGGGPYLDDLISLVNKLNLQDIIKFTGMISTEYIHKYYRLGKAFVTASKSESQGLTYIEALASGCTVLCKWDECVEGLIIEGETGFTYNEDNEFIETLKLILSNDELREKIRENSFNKVNEYSKEKFGVRVLDSYKKLLDNKK